MFKTYNSDKGTGVTLVVNGGDKQLIGFDSDKAVLKVGGATAKCHFFSGDASYSKDHKSLRLEFSTAGKTQAESDGTLKITGDIPVTLASGKEETRSESLTVTTDAEVKFPAAKPGSSLPTLKVKSSGKPKYGDGVFEIEFSTDRRPDDIAGIRFYGKDGKELEAHRGSSGWTSFGGHGSGEMTYSFKVPVTDLVVAVENWTGREEVRVKVDLSAGLAAPK